MPFLGCSPNPLLFKFQSPLRPLPDLYIFTAIQVWSVVATQGGEGGGTRPKPKIANYAPLRRLLWTDSVSRLSGLAGRKIYPFKGLLRFLGKVARNPIPTKLNPTGHHFLVGCKKLQKPRGVGVSVSLPVWSDDRKQWRWHLASAEIAAHWWDRSGLAFAFCKKIPQFSASSCWDFMLELTLVLCKVLCEFYASSIKVEMLRNLLKAP